MTENTRNGTHTWDLFTEYLSCPNCGYIHESRNEYKYDKKIGKKSLTCPRCKKEWEATKIKRNTEPPEFLWDES